MTRWRLSSLNTRSAFPSWRHCGTSASRFPPGIITEAAAAVMAADLASQANSGLIVQMCGDAHVLNFGLWATPERNLMFDLRDFDETLPGPFEWDVMRLAASLIVAGRAGRDQAGGRRRGGQGGSAGIP